MNISHRLLVCREGPLAVYRWFTEGFRAPVLKEAKALLEAAQWKSTTRLPTKHARSGIGPSDELIGIEKV